MEISSEVGGYIHTLTVATNGKVSTAFLVVGKQTYPDDPTRWRLHLVPAPVEEVNRAVRKLRP